MKLYRSLSEATTAFKRKSKEVFAIISFNGQAYFVFRSNPDAEIATIMQVHAKMVIGNEIRHQDTKYIDNHNKFQLFKFMVEANVPELFPKHSQHAEENLIRGFPEAVSKFKATFPNQKIIKIDIFLTHSPCSESGDKKCSTQVSVNGFFLPAGCDKKLIAFFKKENYKSADIQLFTNDTKVKVQYNHVFDSSTTYDDSEFIKEADPILKGLLSSQLDKSG
ncbi:hypothetical protein [Legionella cardiaca]|uniref:APOBEC-like N-terminal domain-containing protein n=1 Tax=Legionella cardiaca TaxID=1071983 RepID=A0ABY8AVU6_9GAMM|nr:hypothetical protein [Legionella cardiaca]WED43252.1 hypothetical protein PXX05_00305 [Legionella cardiaca]